METIAVPKAQFEHLVQENEQLKQENTLLKTGKLQKLYEKAVKMQEQLQRGEIYTRADLKF